MKLRWNHILAEFKPTVVVYAGTTAPYCHCTDAMKLWALHPTTVNEL